MGSGSRKVLPGMLSRQLPYGSDSLGTRFGFGGALWLRESIWAAGMRLIFGSMHSPEGKREKAVMEFKEPNAQMLNDVQRLRTAVVSVFPC